MTLLASVSKHLDLVQWIRNKTNSLPTFPSSTRGRVAGPCFGIAQDHHSAIVRLIQDNMVTSAMTLARAVYESYIRGLWFAHCATDDQVEKFCVGWEPPQLGTMLVAIEAIDDFSAGTLSRIKEESWRAMCDYAHTGALLVQRWNTRNGIEPNFSTGEIEEVLNFSGAISLLSLVGALSVVKGGNNAMDHFQEEILDKIRAFSVTA